MNVSTRESRAKELQILRLMSHINQKIELAQRAQNHEQTSFNRPARKASAASLMESQAQVHSHQDHPYLR